MTQDLKTNITSIGFALGCLILYFYFPVGEFKFQIFFGVITFLLLLPLLYVGIILHKKADSVGFVSLALDMRSGFFLISSIVLGSLFGFFVFTLEWGIQEYLAVLSDTVLYDFGAFLIYEIFFAAPALFLITFFAWGFVYSIKWEKQIYTFIAALITYIILLLSFYSSFWVIMPFLVPAFFVQQIRDEKNIIYFFIVVFSIALVIDTLVIKTFS